MENLVINQVPIVLSDEPIKFFYRFSNDNIFTDCITKEIEPLLLKIKTEKFFKLLSNNENRKNKYFHFKFDPPSEANDEWENGEIDINQEGYFRPIYFDNVIQQYFKANTNLLLEKDFVGNIRLWEKCGENDLTT